MTGMPRINNSRVALALVLIAVGVMAFMEPGAVADVHPGARLILLGIALGGGRAGAAAMSIPP